MLSRESVHNRGSGKGTDRIEIMAREEQPKCER